MRRATLAPPRPGTLGPAEAVAESPFYTELPGPSEAREHRRRWFRPRRGWFRRLERATSNGLARHVFPRVPGIALPYDLQLARSLTLAQVEIPLCELPPAFDGIRVLLVTDVHAGPFVSPGRLRECFGRLMATRPDAVLLGGDLVTCRLEEFVEHREAFSMLRAPLGVFAVLGNHDHYTGDAESLCRLVEQSGIRVLDNRSVTLERAGYRLCLAGVDDMVLGRPDMDAALADAEGPVVLMSHNPDLSFAAARRQVGLVLSGHTHGGQIRWPGLPVLVRQSRFRLDEGRYRIGETEVIVSRGLGAVGLPLRVACPPEAVEITLRCRRA